MLIDQLFNFLTDMPCNRQGRCRCWRGCVTDNQSGLTLNKKKVVQCCPIRVDCLSTDSGRVGGEQITLFNLRAIAVDQLQVSGPVE